MIPRKRAHLYVSAITHPGLKGKNNEDRFAVSAYQVGPRDPTPSLLAIISDGIGGHRAGEIAAEMVVEIISQAVATSDASHPLETLGEAIVRASQAVRNQSESNLEQKGMGATCACVWIIADQLFIAYVGDSRIYLVRDGSIQKLTTDHTWIQEALDYGALTPDQARNHPNAHVIRRYLGSQRTVEPDFRLRLNPEETDSQAVSNQGVRLQPGDLLILCSDGLTDLVEEVGIYSAFIEKGRNEALSALVQLANERGGHDNITIVALEMPKTPNLSDEETRPLELRTRNLPVAILILIAVGIFVGILLVGLLGWYYTRPGPMATGTSTQLATPTEAFLSTQVSTQVIVTPTFEVTSAVVGPTRASPLLTYTPWPTNTNSPLDTPPSSPITPTIATP